MIVVPARPLETAKKTDTAPTVPNVQPAKALENQPEAHPETGPGLPPIRPFSLDHLVKGLVQVERNLESQMDDMEAQIRTRR